MKISPYLNIERLEFIVTYQCSGKCIHCSLGDDCNQPGEYRQVDPAAAKRAVRELSAIFPLSSVMTFGGEPLLYPDTVYAVHQATQSCGIAKRQIITNGYFTKDPSRRKKVAQSLNECGVNDLMLSVDAFHQQDIPFEPVYDFAKCAKEAGIRRLRLHPAWVVDEPHENPYNAKTRQVLDRFADLDIPVSSGNNIFMAGNAAKHLSAYYPPPCLDLSKTCGSLPYTSPLTDITGLSVSPNGDVTICGFAIGNIYRESMGEIAARYDPYANRIMRAILEGGAAGLLELAKADGIPADCSACYSICDLCHQISRQAHTPA